MFLFILIRLFIYSLFILCINYMKVVFSVSFYVLAKFRYSLHIYGLFYWALLIKC